MNYAVSSGDASEQRSTTIIREQAGLSVAASTSHTAALEEQLTYWRQQLADIPLLALPTDRPRQPLTNQQQEALSFALPKPLLKALQTLSEQVHVPLFVTLLAGFQVLLSRYSSQEDIAVSTPGIKGVMRLVLRSYLNNNATLHEVLAHVHEVTLQAYAHADWSFELAAEVLRVEQGTDAPLTQAAFALQNVLSSAQDNVVYSPEPPSAMLDLNLTLILVEGTLGGTLTFNADLFDTDTIHRMIGHYQVVLEQMTTHPQQTVQQVVVLTEEERYQLLVAWNATTTDYPDDHCTHQLFEAQAARIPEACSVMDEYSRLSYQELNEQANQLAHYLRTLGVGPAVMVGVSLERSCQMLVCLLAILKAGSTYIPLDPSFPLDRLAYMMEDAQITVLLTQHTLSTQLPVPAQVRIICIDSDRPDFAQQSKHNLDVIIDPAQLAYVLYTSGSTGKPKGVQISQQALVNFLCSMQHEPGLAAGDSLLAVTTLSFDIAGLELFLPLLVGARVVIANRDTATNGLALARALEEVHATMLQATPVTWRLLVNSGWSGKADLTALCGGEALPLDLAEQLVPRVQALYNMYGPTETTIWSTLSHVRSAAETITIGHPIANTLIYILDTNMQPVPIGIPGELYIGGDSVARGYLHRPELTQERFLSNPFVTGTTSRPARIYRTGDLARYLPNGNIEHLGRLDHQVKIRGFRIELGEIEAVLHQYPTIKQAVMVAREDKPGEKHLVAYIILTQSGQESNQTSHTSGEFLAELRTFLRQQLPEYMLPTAFVFLDDFPLTPNGKVNRQGLPAPTTHKASAAEVSTAAYVPPQEGMEQTIAEIWQKHLGVSSIGAQDHFDELGGDSLQAFLIISQIYKTFQFQLSVKDFPITTTVAAITNTLKEKLAASIDMEDLEALLAEFEEA